MKTTLLAMATIASLGMTATAQAADVTFTGAVSAKTCELVPEVDGGVNNLVDLGTVDVNSLGGVVQFTFKAKEIANCASGGMLTEMQWSGAALGAIGLNATSGSADDATVLLVAKGTKDVNITKTTDIAEFTVEQVTAGVTYTAQLKSGAKAGTFRTAAAYSVAYK